MRLRTRSTSMHARPPWLRASCLLPRQPRLGSLSTTPAGRPRSRTELWRTASGPYAASPPSRPGGAIWPIMSDADFAQCGDNAPVWALAAGGHSRAADMQLGWLARGSSDAVRIYDCMSGGKLHETATSAQVTHMWRNCPSTASIPCLIASAQSGVL